MKKFKLVFLATSILFLFSCKKEKSTEPINSNTSSTSTLYDGILEAGIFQYMTSGTLSPPYTGANVWFGNTPDLDVNSTNFVHVDSVSLSNIYLKFDMDHYYDTTALITLPPVAWHVIGNNGIPSFNFTNTNALPSFSGYSSLPDSLDHTQNFTIPISGVSNATKAVAYISDNLGHYALQFFNIPVNSITFSASSLSTLSPTTYGNYYIIFKNENVQTIGGKKIKFNNFYQIMNNIKIN
jgi:hypothetical protein